MTGTTHAAAGMAAAAAVLAATHPVRDPALYAVCLACGAAAALLPDVDEPRSTVNRYAVVVGPAVGRAIRHRTVTHSLAALAALVLLVRGLWPAVPASLWRSVGAGFASHLLTDALTPDGAMWFWPVLAWRVSFVRWLPSPLDRLFRTGGWFERVVARNACLAGALALTGIAWR